MAMLFLCHADALASQSSYGRAWRASWRACQPKAVGRTHVRRAYALRWKVYPGFIPDGDQIVCKTYMTRVEGENTRLRHCALSAHRRCFRNGESTYVDCPFAPKDFVLFKIKNHAATFSEIVNSLSKIQRCSSSIHQKICFSLTIALFPNHTFIYQRQNIYLTSKI